MQSSQGSKPLAHFCVSVLISNMTKALCKALASICKVIGGSPGAFWKGQSVLCHSLLHQEMELTSRAGQRSPTSSCPQGLGRIKPHGRKTKRPEPTLPCPAEAGDMQLQEFWFLAFLPFSTADFSWQASLSLPTAQDPVSHTCTFITYQAWLHPQAHNNGKQKRSSLTGLSTQKV